MEIALGAKRANEAFVALASVESSCDIAADVLLQAVPRLIETHQGHVFANTTARLSQHSSSFENKQRVTDSSPQPVHLSNLSLCVTGCSLEQTTTFAPGFIILI